METDKFRYYEFGEFRIDSKRQILFKNNEQIPVSARIFGLLLVMVRNEGRILEHDELLDKVWEGMFVEQSNLKKSVSALRQVLGEQPSESLYIKTVPRRGYSFVSPVRALPDDATTAFYRETEAEIIVEEIIEDEPSALPPAARPQLQSAASVFTKLKTHRIALALVFLVLIGTAFLSIRHFRSKPSFNYSVENVRARRLTNEGNLGNTAPISPDGNYLVYPVYFGQQGSLWLKQVETGSVARLTPVIAAQFWGYDFSPDGNYVYYIVNRLDEPANSGVYRIPTIGGTPQKIFDRGSGGLSFAPDGSRFAFTRATEDASAVEVVTAKADGSDLRKAFVVPDDKFLWSLKWSPDSLNLLYAMRGRDGGDGGQSFSYVAETPWNNDSATAAENIVLPKQADQYIINAAWLPDKTSLLLSVREPFADICQLWQYVPSTGEKRRITNDDSSYRFINLTRDGATLSTVQENSQSEAWIASDAALDFQPVAGLKNLGNIFWTRDDKLIFETLENRQETIFASGADGSDRQPLTKGGHSIYLFATPSQDGRYITFISNRSGTSQIWRINADGGDLRQLTNDPRVIGLHSKLLSDGQTLLFMTHTRQTGWNLQKQTAGGTVEPVIKVDTGEWSVSPDGQWLAVEREDEKTKKIRTYIQDLETGEILKSFDFTSGRQLSWTRDGRSLAYISLKSDADELILQPLDETPAKILSSTRGMRIYSFDWSSDGSKLIVVRRRNTADAFLIRAQENFGYLSQLSETSDAK